jgi:predicted transcriptional regulator
MFQTGRNVSRMNEKQPPMRHFGGEVEARIAARGMTLREVSDGAGIPLATLHRKLKSPGMDFTLAQLTAIAELLGTTAGVIVSEFEAAA